MIDVRSDNFIFVLDSLAIKWAETRLAMNERSHGFYSRRKHGFSKNMLFFYHAEELIT